jgi:hypothetical protein
MVVLMEPKGSGQNGNWAIAYQFGHWRMLKKKVKLPIEALYDIKVIHKWSKTQQQCNYSSHKAKWDKKTFCQKDKLTLNGTWNSIHPKCSSDETSFNPSLLKITLPL